MPSTQHPGSIQQQHVGNLHEAANGGSDEASGTQDAKSTTVDTGTLRFRPDPHGDNSQRRGEFQQHVPKANVNTDRRDSVPMGNWTDVLTYRPSTPGEHNQRRGNVQAFLSSPDGSRYQ